VVEHVDEHHRVIAGVRAGQGLTVEFIDGDVGMWPHQHVQAGDGQVRPLLHDQPGNPAIPAADIQDPCLGGQNSRQMLGQLPNPPAEDVLPMDVVEQGHVIAKKWRPGTRCHDEQHHFRPGPGQIQSRNLLGGANLAICGFATARLSRN
jgi:hypothetical protein